MKRLYVIALSLLIGFAGIVLAADFDLGVSPSNQFAISGTVVNFDVNISNNTGVDAIFSQILPAGVLYQNSSETPDNSPALSLGTQTNPYWSLSSGESLSFQVQAIVTNQSFASLNVNNVFTDTLGANVYTSSVVSIDPISDIVVTNIMTSNEPQITGDLVSYNIEIKNIGSALATGVRLVDVRPHNILSFSNIGLVNGVSQIPNIYNGLANNYLFNIGDIFPGGFVNVQLEGNLNGIGFAGQSFDNQSFVLVDSAQYDTTNDSDTSTNTVKGVADVYVNVSALSTDPAVVGDEISYQISYGNNGIATASGVVLQTVLDNVFSFVSSSVSPTNQITNNVSWDLGDLSAGQNGQIILTGIYNGGLNIGDVFTNNVQVSTISTELDISNNNDLLTGTIVQLSEMSIKLYANNLTDPSRNIDTDTDILAISGDLVELEIVISNSGNILDTGNVSLSNINGFVNYNGLTAWTVSVAPGLSQSIILTGIVGPKNFVNFVPVANLTYNSNLDTDDVNIDEPLVCGDGLITQDELCDTNATNNNLLPGQYCENQNGQCVLVTENITNRVCMEYTTDLGTGEQCVNVMINYEQEEEDVMCESLESEYGVVIADEDGDGSMEFVCYAESGLIADEITIDCNNGDSFTANAVNSLSYDCDFEFDENGDIDDNLYQVTCYVEGETNDDCQKEIRVDEGFYGVCGDGSLDDGEECDLGGDEDEEIDIDEHLDLDGIYDAGRYEDDGYYCEDCRIRKDDTDEFVYQAPQCLGVNTTISVMENEIVPFRWRLWDRDEQMVKNNYDCDEIDEDETRTIIDKDSMQCTFVVYDGDNNQQVNEDDVNSFTVPCFDVIDGDVFDYFEEEYGIDFDKQSGRYVYNVSSVLDGNEDKTYGEYKLVLEEVNYEYCDPVEGDWQEGRLYEGVCEVNFALTRPYMMQISTFGIQPVATNADFLEDFYDMDGDRLIDSTDIEDTMDVDGQNYGFDSDVQNQVANFKNQYEPLSIEVDKNFEVRNNKTIGDLFGYNSAVKKVPNQSIYFVNGDGDLILKQLTQYFPGTPFTIYVEGMDVIVEGSVTTNGMVITDGTIYFEDDSDQNYCEVGGQKVQGIFVAQDGFAKPEFITRNADEDDERCPWGNLHVQGVLIGNDIDRLMANKRSHLNDWFQVDSNDEDDIKVERRNEIFEGAALLIEYNPSLWTQLPPGAQSFTEVLDVYKQ